MKTNRRAAPWIGLLTGAAAVAAILAFRRRQQPPYFVEEELGTFVYSYPLDLEEEAEEEREEPDNTESALLDEEMFPGHHG